MALPGGGDQPFLQQIGNAPYQFDVPVIWDPVPDSDFKRFEVFRAAELEIIDVNQGAKKFSIQGHFASWYIAGDSIVVTGTNAGTYTVVAATEPSGQQQTDIGVAEAIPSTTVDGTLTQALISFLAYNGKANGFTDKLLPTGTYYYVVYAYDEVDNISDPSDIIIKNSPYDIAAPADPTGLVARRNNKLTEVDLSWIENAEVDFKGYGILRSFDGISYDLVALTTKNSFTDKNIPPHEDLDSNSTPVIYSVFAYDKAFFVSGGASPTTPLWMPNIVGVRGIIDFLSINVSWTKPLPELLDDPDNTEINIYFKKITDANYVLAGTVDYPISTFRIEGPLDEDTTYMVGLNIFPFTGSTVYLQPDPIPVTIPDYTDDIIPPYAPVLEIAEPDPRNDRILLAWMRRIVDDDLLYYDVKWSSKWDIAALEFSPDKFDISGDYTEFIHQDDIILAEGTPGLGNDGEYEVLSVEFSGGLTRVEVPNIPSASTGGTIKNFITYKTTKDNEVVFRNPRRTRTYGAPNFEMYFRVDAVDRANNRTRGLVEEVRLVSQDSAPPQWYDQLHVVQSSYQTSGQHYELRWDDAAQFMKYFRRYLIYESISWNAAGYPNFTFSDHELAGTSVDNLFRYPNTPSIRGSGDAGHIGEKWVVIAVEDWWGDVFYYVTGPAGFLWMQLP